MISGATSHEGTDHTVQYCAKQNFAVSVCLEHSLQLSPKQAYAMRCTEGMHASNLQLYCAELLFQLLKFQ
jgi:hypothetical protein